VASHIAGIVAQLQNPLNSGRVLPKQRAGCWCGRFSYAKIVSLNSRALPAAEIVSKEGFSVSATEPTTSTVDLNRNPSYPQRVHIRERAAWQKRLADAEAQIAASRQSSQANRAGADLILAQMAGARDQIADAIRRLPMEVGELYEEDAHRVHEAEQALKRLVAKLQG
jgi:hypothetical protein